MKWMLDPPEVKIPSAISPGQHIFLLGSCFTANIGIKLQRLKFRVLPNPSGILFDPHSISRHLLMYCNQTTIRESDLFQAGEFWHSWNHHSDFSALSAGECLQKIQTAHTQASQFLRQAHWLILTLGSSYSYRLAQGEIPVANCHRQPQQHFVKQLMCIEETVSCLKNSIEQCRKFNPALQVIFTVSPVRHVRDGVVENNRSKARLLEAVHRLCNEGIGWYFPAYELVLDVLRDYRYFDTDLVHPNYAATEFVFEHFCKASMTTQTQKLLEDIGEIVRAAEHKPMHGSSQAHKQFLRQMAERVAAVSALHPELDFTNERNLFSSKPN